MSDSTTSPTIEPSQQAFPVLRVRTLTLLAAAMVVLFGGWTLYVPWRAVRELQQAETDNRIDRVEIEFRHPKWLDRWTTAPVFVPYVDRVIAIWAGAGATPRLLENAAEFPELVSLVTDRAVVDDRFLYRIRGLRNLETVGIAGRGVTDDGLQYVGEFENLVQLTLRNTSVTDDGLAHLSRLNRLLILEISDSPVRGSGLRHVARLSSLYAVEINNESTASGSHIRVPRKWSDFTPQELAEVRESLRSMRPTAPLEHLRLIGLPIDDDSVASIVAFRGITHLDLSGAAITDDGVRRLRALAGLKWMRLDETRITDAGLDEIAAWPHLIEFTCEQCKDVTTAGWIRLRSAKPALSHL